MLPFSCCFVWNSLTGVSTIIIKLSAFIRFKSCILTPSLNISSLRIMYSGEKDLFVM